jgi:broad specificity phosphatase PhoE
MTIYLVRHGRAAAGVEDLDPGLDQLGHEQASAVARRISSLLPPPSSLVVSPLRRTRETAAPIAAALGLSLELREEVAEVFDPSMPADERRAMIGPFMAGRWSEQPAHLRAWRARVVDTLLEMGLAAESSGHHLVVVSHYIAIGVAVGEATGDDRVVPVAIANASITSLKAGHGGLELLEAGSVAHLAPEQVTGIHTALMGRG